MRLISAFRWPLLSLVALEGALFIGSFSFLSGPLESRFGLDSMHIGLILASAGVAQLAGARLLPRLRRRFSERELIMIGGSVMAGSNLIYASARHWGWVVFACTWVGIGFSLCHSTLQTRATEAFVRARGIALALFAFSLFSGSALGTVCVGYAADAIGYGPTFAFTGLALFVFMALAVRTLASRKPVAEAAVDVR